MPPWITGCSESECQSPRIATQGGESRARAGGLPDSRHTPTLTLDSTMDSTRWTRRRIESLMYTAH